MGLFFNKKKDDPSMPHKDWPWTLTVGGAPHSNPTAEEVYAALDALIPDNDSFVILEQRDPKDSKEYWFIQSALALAGPDIGRYIVGLGWRVDGKPVLWEKCVTELKAAKEEFARVLRGEALDMSTYEDQNW